MPNDRSIQILPLKAFKDKHGIVRKIFSFNEINQKLNIGETKLFVKRELEKLNLGESLGDAVKYLTDENFERKGVKRDLTRKEQIINQFKNIDNFDNK